MKKLLPILPIFFTIVSLAQQTPDYEKLSKACKLWGIIKYFHPTHPEQAFDSAFAAYVPQMLVAKSEEEWTRVLSDWLNVLHDPLTTVVSPSDEGSDGRFHSEFTSDSVLIVTFSGSKFNNDWASARRMFQALNVKAAKGIIFDLRQPTRLVRDYQGSINFYLDASGLPDELATHIVPQYKSKYYSGFVAERGGSSGGNSSNTILKNAVNPGVFHLSKRKMAWVVNQHSELPVLALSQQAAGVGYVISDIENIDQLLPLSKTFSFSDHLQISVKDTELILPGASGLRADTVYNASTDPIEIAKKIIIGNHRSKDTKISTNRTVSKTNPQAYPPDAYHQVGYRILAAAKIFTVIDYFFPYRQLMDRDWNAVLEESLPEFVSASNEVEYGLAVAKMYANIQDSHGFISGNKGLAKIRGEAVAPFTVGWIENQVVITHFRNDSACKAHHLAVGDVVLQVDGVTTVELMKKFYTYFAHSTPDVIHQAAAEMAMRGPKEQAAVFKIRDAKGKTRDVSVQRTNVYNRNFVIKPAQDTLVRVVPDIGYADLTRMEQRQTDKMFEMFRDTRAIIFDMRGYPKGTAWSIVPRLTDKKNLPLAIFRRLEARAPNIPSGDIIASQTITESTQTISPSLKWKYTGKTVMLINHDAISQSEHTGLFFEKANNTIFIGSPTAGANGDVTNFEIPGGMVLFFSGNGVWHGDGRQLQRVGLQPHVTVRPTIKGIRAGKDEVLERAIEWINKNVK